jgi:hypothetical protein
MASLQACVSTADANDIEFRLPQPKSKSPAPHLQLDRAAENLSELMPVLSGTIRPAAGRARLEAGPQEIVLNRSAGAAVCFTHAN